MTQAPATSPPATAGRSRASLRTLATLLGLAAGVWQGVLMSSPTNDDFLHMALGQQLVAGDWPVRDFFDNGLGLQLTLSALSQTIVGHRLLSEALVVGAAWAAGTFLVVMLVGRLTGSMPAAILAAALLIASGPRGYSYPKLIVYAGAATLWWAYVWNPTAARSAALGAWIAAAFFWRPDHGILVAAGAALALLAAHGLQRLLWERCALAAVVTLAVTAPFLLFVQATIGLRQYVETGFAQAGFQHEGGHEWPEWPLRRLDDVIRVDAAERYAPRIAVRWTADSSPAARADLLERYGLTSEASEGPRLQHVRLSRWSVDAARRLLSEPIVEDTDGIDRSTATLPWSRWAPWDRWKFEYAWLRV